MRSANEQLEALGWGAWQEGALREHAPTVVRNKTDLCADWSERVEQVSAHLPTLRVLPVSAHSGEGADVLPSAIGLRLRRTATLMGPSGVGKSSLVKHLLGSNHEDGRRSQRRPKGEPYDDTPPALPPPWRRGAHRWPGRTRARCLGERGGRGPGIPRRSRLGEPLRSPRLSERHRSRLRSPKRCSRRVPLRGALVGLPKAPRRGCSRRRTPETAPLPQDSIMKTTANPHAPGAHQRSETSIRSTP